MIRGMEADRLGLVAHPKRFLAGKFFTSLVSPSLDRTESSLRHQWKLSGSLKVLPLEKDNIILFEFEEKRDKKEVVKGGPWNVDGTILVLKKFSQDISMVDIDFSVACFKVTVIGLPKFNYTEDDVEKIVKKLSDKPWISYKYNEFTRRFCVKVEIDLKKPLPPGFYINGKSRRRPFVQFKYKNLGEFCEHCGMINHRICGETAKMRPLTRKFKTRVYGPWLRYDHEVLACNGLPVKLHYSQPKQFVDMGLTYEETVTYAQFMVVVQVDVVYKSEQEWEGKKLVRSLLVSGDNECFRFSCFPTQVIKDVLAFEIDRISPLAKLKSDDKTSIVLGLMVRLMKQRKTWSKKRWIPYKVRVEKTVTVPPVDMEVMLEEAKDKKLHKTINTKIVKMVGSPLGKSDDLLMKTIRDALREVGQTQFPDSFVESWLISVKRAKYYSRLIMGKDCHQLVKVLGPDMDLFDTCCICQEGFFLGDYATITSCSHVFHSVCITDWILKSPNPKCPLCCVQLEVYTLMI
ncbi:Uncharacterized protein HA466_0217650 [Hirschfeldia incana]|nr:Uncharacterized protein HA466_0217650 [Hirschfeldia incana]